MDSIFVAMTANLNSSKVRRVMRGGEEYLVASGSSINPGVLSGSKGPLYYPAEEASRNVADWDGMPMVVYHPITSAGQHVSANHPGVRERQQIGHIEASKFDGKLRHEHWFKVSSLRNAKAGDPFKDAKQTIYDRLMRNQPIETSTGLYTDNEPSPGICPKTGRHYDAVARNYRPDHLAVLPDQIGACSVNDGCGVLVNSSHAERPTMDNLSFLQKILGVLTGTSHSDVSVATNADQGRHPRDGTYQGKAGNSAKVGYSDLDAKRQQVGPGNQEAGTSGRDGRNVDLTKRVADTFQHHDGKGNDSDDDSDDDGQLVDSPDLKVKADKKVGSQSQQVSVNESFEDGGTSPMYAGDQQSNPAHVASKQAAAASVGTEQGDARDAALGAVDASKDQDHDAAADGHVGAAKLHEKAAVGALKDKDAMGADDHMRAAALHRKAAMLHSATMNEENAMLTANKDFTSDAERKAAFAAMADEGGSKSAVAASAHANKTGTAGAHSKAAAAHREAAEHHKEEGNTELAGMHKKAEYGHRQKAAKLTKNQLIPAAIIANCGCEETRQRLLQLNAKAEGSNADVSGSGEVQAGGEDDADDHDYDSDDSGYAGKAESAVKGKKNMQTKVGAAMNTAQYLANMPSEMRETWNRLQRREKQAKAAVVNRMVANIGNDAQRKQVFNQFMQLPEKEFAAVALTFNAAQQHYQGSEQVENELEPLYLGAAAPVGNGSYDSQPDVDDVIPIRNCIGDIVREAAEAKA